MPEAASIFLNVLSNLRPQALSRHRNVHCFTSFLHPMGGGAGLVVAMVLSAVLSAVLAAVLSMVLPAARLHAQEPASLVRSLQTDASLPDVIQSDASSIQWKLNFPGNDKVNDQPNDAANVSHPNAAESVGKSSSGKLAGWSMDVVPVDRQASRKLNSQPAIVSIQDGLQATLATPLEPGVYQVRLRPPATPRKWTKLFPWERETPAKSIANPLTWPLLVIAPTANELIETSREGSFDGQMIVNWDDRRSVLDRLPSNDSKSKDSGLSSILPGSGSATKILNRLPTTWRDGSQRSSDVAFAKSNAMVWANRLERIRDRVDRIVALNATGILLPNPSEARPDDDDIATSHANDNEADLIWRLVESEADAAGLQVWYRDKTTASVAETSEVENSEVETSEAKRERRLSLRSNDQLRTVADFRRPPPTNLQSRFTPRFSSANQSDLVWFGHERSHAMARFAETSEANSGTESVPMPILDSIDGLSSEMWLADWTNWVIHWKDARASDSVGMVIDESLIGVDSDSKVERIEEAFAVWQFGWGKDSRWLRASTAAPHSSNLPAPSIGSRSPNGPEPGINTAISSKSLVRVRQVHHHGATVLVILNEAPWPMRVTLPLANPIQWNSTFGVDGSKEDGSASASKWSSLSMTRPSVSMLGSTLTVPANGIVVCQTNQELSRDLTFSCRIEGGAVAIEELTEDVTKIVEHLGLLGELASLTRSAADAIVKSDVNAPTNTSSNARPSAEAHRQSKTSNNQSRPDGWAASIWSSDRWGLSRAISNQSSTGKASGNEQSHSSQSSAHLASAPMVADMLEEIGESKAIAGDQIGEGNARGKSGGVSASSQPASRFETYRNLIRNGGFELPHEVGITGWMHSQHPSNAVEVETRLRHSGSNCIRLLGKDERGSTAWLISRGIATPPSGRLGVSMALRGQRSSKVSREINHDAILKTEMLAASPPKSSQEPQNETDDLIVRIAIEGERDGQPVRHSTELKLSPDGQWKPGRIDLQVLDLHLDRDANLRLTIDNLSPSSVWIDDIVVTDYFASQFERSELQSLAYLAVNGLQSSDLAPTARLLRNYWAQELLRVADQSPVSLLSPGETILSESSPIRESAGVAIKRSLRIPSGEPPSSIWGVATEEASVGSQRIFDIQHSGPHAGMAPVPEAGVESTQRNQKVAEQTPVTTEPEKEKPVSLSRRIRSWIPAPLRF